MTNSRDRAQPLLIAIIDGEVVMYGLGPASIVLTADEALDIGIKLMSAAVEIDAEATSSKV